ncbi:DUF4401 domain-containing protein [Veronia nyctiphanis]|uniref:DUF4401 domain-containing protein n=1 Tax=Veronia nyctiphanis TaxID=1278244 RepID=UPI001F27E49B|nr:DUF4401 domain-containing protein [Veronia nyctiphanis]
MNGLTTGMTIMLVGVYSGQRMIQGLGIANMMMFASIYYFNLDTTLLYKSITLALLGIVLLAGRWFLLQQSKHTNIENKGDNQ